MKLPKTLVSLCGLTVILVTATQNTAAAIALLAICLFFPDITKSIKEDGSPFSWRMIPCYL